MPEPAKKPYEPPRIESSDLNFSRAAHCGQCDEGNGFAPFTEIHPSACDTQPEANS